MDVWILKIRKIDVKNYRSLKKLVIYPNDILALVGRNNSGKSNVLRALQLFFEGTKKQVTDECFYRRDTRKPIEIFITFEELSRWEKKHFEPWMDGDKLIVGRTIICDGSDGYEIKTLAVLTIPDYEWLQQDVISGKKITEWWAKKDELKIDELDFGLLLGKSKPTVGKWSELAKEFFVKNRDKIKVKIDYKENPKGYTGVLKGALPKFIFIPAVRDVSDEAKVTKTNPFGQLINSVLEEIPAKNKNQLSKKLVDVEKLLNRSNAGGNRISEIRAIEDRLNALMDELMDCDVEIEMNLPKLNDIFSGAKIYANDGIRTSIETKGHGMQRSLIFTILRAYADLMCSKIAGEHANEKTTVFAIEEPELYLHPHSQLTMMSVFRKIVECKDQVIYCTHSSLFVDIGHFDEIGIMRRKKVGLGYYSKCTQFFMSELLDDLKLRTGINGTLEGIREGYSNVFNPMINGGFFADKVVIVEGLSEEYSLPIYSSIFDYDLNRNNVSVVHSTGKGPIDRLMRVFNGFEIPIFVWFDGDKNNQKQPAKDKTLELLELLGEPIARIDDLKTKVTNRYAVLEETYEKLLKDEIADYDKIIENATKKFGPIGKPLKHRYIANEIKSQVDAGAPANKTVPRTIIKIVNKVKKISYKGSILQKAN